MRNFPRLGGDTLEAVIAWVKNVNGERLGDIAEINQLVKQAGFFRTLKSVITAVGNIGGGEDDLISYTLPAATFTRPGQYFEIEGTVTTAANANNKRLRIKFGATTIYDSGAVASNNETVAFKFRVIRTGASTQISTLTITSASTLIPTRAVYTATTENEQAAIVFKCTGEATADNDIVQRMLTVKWFDSSI